MLISELEQILKETREDYGDTEINFGRYENEVGGYYNCDVEIKMDTKCTKLNITVI